MLWLAYVLAATSMAYAQTTYSETVLHNFSSPPKGANPYAGVIRDAAGNLYGTTAYGGASNQGVVFKVNTTGHLTVLYSFTGGDDGAAPSGGVVGDSAGNLYGTTTYGGSSNSGVVYRLDTTGHESVLHTFTAADGLLPYAGLIRDGAGNLYGTTPYGGTAGAGIIFKVDPTGQFTVLYNFTGTDGGIAYAGVVRDPAGNLYGTTYSGGTADFGVVYKLDAAGNYTVLYSFTGEAGGRPWAGVVRDSAGSLYGAAGNGGREGAGVVYKLDAAGQETVLYSFTGGTDGGAPQAGLVRDSAGNVYGTTYSGGGANAGVVYKLDATGQQTVLYSFTGAADGGHPVAGLIQDPAGNLYGTTNAGGVADVGVVYEVNSAGQETTLYGFPGGDGWFPFAGLIHDSTGNFYGTTYYGGAADMGAVYKLDTAGNYAVLYSFAGGTDGANPLAGVTLDSSGSLYGTTNNGGEGGFGVVFKLNTAGQETVLHSFTGGADGEYPNGGVIVDPYGNLYGTTTYGGAANAGVVYKVDAAGQYSVLHSFNYGDSDGANPYAGVIFDSAGNLYGTTYSGGAVGAGIVYKLNAAGQETVLHSFAWADGACPSAGVVRDSAGSLYGTTYLGGAGDWGVVYKLDTSGVETVLYAFAGGADGLEPMSGVIRDSAGNLYGTTQYGGGTANAGVVYKLDTAGQETVLYTFTGGGDGGAPYAGVIGDSAGNLYGTTHENGKWSGGVVFKLTP
ncbi:MAG TPA: choice-of-anchor tandem repeat GloVer-containing protein [Bryobacteraceae bacterium]|nr:choice-of-anchor tandem repeat GloVer-containing protein [Bryobacteraceae bacterium]